MRRSRASGSRDLLSKARRHELEADDSNEWLTKAEAAAFADVSVRTLERAAKRGALKMGKPQGGFVRINIREVKAWLAGGFVLLVWVALVAWTLFGTLSFVHLALDVEALDELMMWLGCPTSCALFITFEAALGSGLPGISTPAEVLAGVDELVELVRDEHRRGGWSTTSIVAELDGRPVRVATDGGIVCAFGLEPD